MITLKEVTFLPTISQIWGSNVLQEAAIFIPGNLKGARVLSLFEERKAKNSGESSLHWTHVSCLFFTWPKEKLCFLFYSKVAASFMAEIMLATIKDLKLNRYSEVNNKVSIKF